MVFKEPKFMRELHKIREQISKECRHRPLREVINTAHKKPIKLKGGRSLNVERESNV